MDQFPIGQIGHLYGSQQLLKAAVLQTGKETFQLLKSTNPEIKVLLSSGYSINGAVDEILREGCDGFIQKPFNAFQLSVKIRSILDAGAKVN